MDFKDYFNRAMTIEDYTPLLGDKAKLHSHHFCRAKLDSSLETTCSSTCGVKVLSLTEPWCGDSLAILPVIQRFVSHCYSASMRVLLRDSNLNLMDQHLTRGGRAVPIFFFLDTNFNLLFKWGPRPQAAQDIFEKNRQQIIDGRIEKEAVIKKIRRFYSLNRGRAILEEICRLAEEAGLVKQPPA